MYNTYANGSDTTKAISSEQFSQNSNPNQHLQQTHQQQQDKQPQQHGDYQSPLITRNGKHILYIDDYTDNPPSYNIAQENYQMPQTSDANTRVAAFPNSIEEIPLDPYHAHSPPEPETAPLMYEQDDHIIHRVPLVDRMGLRIYNPFDKSRSVRQIPIARYLLGFVVFAFGITLMAIGLATVKCNNQCEGDECSGCQSKTNKGLMAAAFIFFTSTSLCILWKIVKIIVY